MIKSSKNPFDLIMLDNEFDKNCHFDDITNSTKNRTIILQTYLGYFKYDEEIYSKIKKIITIKQYKELLSVLNSIITQTKLNLRQSSSLKDNKIIKYLYFWSWISIFLFIIFVIIGVNTYSHVATIFSILCLCYIILLFSGLFLLNFFSKQATKMSYEESMKVVSEEMMIPLINEYEDVFHMEFIVGKPPTLKIFTLKKDLVNIQN